MLTTAQNNCAVTSASYAAGVGEVSIVDNARTGAGFAEDGMAVRHRGQSDRVHHREGVKGVALDTVAQGGRVNEAEVEVGIVSGENSALAAVALDLPPHYAE